MNDKAISEALIAYANAIRHHAEIEMKRADLVLELAAEYATGSVQSGPEPALTAARAYIDSIIATLEAKQRANEVMAAFQAVVQK